jgi:RHS repeat-associated protein
MFDANGNQRVEVKPDGSRTTNTWDYENRLTKVELPSGVRNTMAYDPDGLRVKLEDSTGTSKFVWDDQNILLETDASDLTQVVYTLEPVVYGNLISQRRAGSTHWYHSDALGSTSHLTDVVQAITDSYVYKAFGEAVSATGTTTNPFRYVGELGYYLDPDSGQLYIRARVYRPLLARWLSRDLVFLPSRTNLYEYSRSNPLLYSDPSGLVPVICECLCGIWPFRRKLEVETNCTGLIQTCCKKACDDMVICTWNGKWRRKGQPPPPPDPWPGYGNYCGPRCNEPLPPIDCVDTCCRQHDRCLATFWDWINPFKKMDCQGRFCACLFWCNCNSSPNPSDCKTAKFYMMLWACPTQIWPLPLP